MEELVIPIILAVLLLIASVLFASIYRHRKGQKDAAANMNCDRLRERFVYRIPMDESRLMETLQTRSIFDLIEYDLDEENSCITFRERKDKLAYSFSVMRKDGMYILRLRQRGSRFTLKNADKLILQINPFWKGKCGAVPLPYAKYGEEDKG